MTSLQRTIPSVPTVHGAERLHPGMDGERIEALAWGHSSEPGILCVSCRDAEAVAALALSSNAGLITESRGRDTVTRSVSHQMAQRFPQYEWVSEGKTDMLLGSWVCKLDHASEIHDAFPIMQVVFQVLHKKLSRHLPVEGSRLRVVEMTSIPYRTVSWGVAVVSP